MFIRIINTKLIIIAQMNEVFKPGPACYGLEMDANLLLLIVFFFNVDKDLSSLIFPSPTNFDSRKGSFRNYR